MFPGMPWQSQPPTPSHFPASSLQEITEVFSDTADSFPLLLYYINIIIIYINIIIIILLSAFYREWNWATGKWSCLSSHSNKEQSQNWGQGHLSPGCALTMVLYLLLSTFYAPGTILGTILGYQLTSKTPDLMETSMRRQKLISTIYSTIYNS